MKKVSLLGLLAACFLLTIACYVPPQYHSVSIPITIPAGTTIEIVLNQDLNFDNCKPKNEIRLKTYRRVVVAKHEVICAESDVKGEVSDIEYTCGGRCAKVYIIVKSVLAINGKHLHLNKQEFTIYLERKKGKTVVSGMPQSFIGNTRYDDVIEA